MPTIKELLKQKGILQKQLALDLGVSQPTISDWINGKKEPTPDNLGKLAEYFQVERNEIDIENRTTTTFSTQIPSIPNDEYSGLANAIVERLLDNSEAASLSPIERRLITAFREADERAQRDALNTLLSYPVKKKTDRA